MKYLIVELDRMPADKIALQRMIDTARQQIRRKRLTMWAAANFAFWAVYIIITQVVL